MSDDDRDHDPFAHGRVCYLQLPAADLAAAREFYAGVFGWTVEDTGFEAPGLIGQWITDRAPADAGPLLWLAVSDLGGALEAVRTHGGTVDADPWDDGGERRLALVRDPAGNPLGLAAHP